jgi:ketosteroid isomerase-like protein
MLSPGEMADASLARAAAKDRAGWLALLADDICIRDPVGGAPYDPDGKGFDGKAEATRLWDTVIGTLHHMKVEVHERYVGGNQAASVFTLTITARAGDAPMAMRGICVHTVNDQGKLAELRTYFTPAGSRHPG